MTEVEHPQLTSWQRWLFVLCTAGLGLTMLAIGVSEFRALLGDLRALPPQITVSSAMAGFVPLGLGILAISLLGVFPPAAAQAARRAGRKPPPDIGRPVVIAVLVCLLLYPALALTLRAVTSSKLESRGYRQATIDQGFRSSFTITRWTRANPTQPVR